jgi:hypothetical protein
MSGWLASPAATMTARIIERTNHSLPDARDIMRVLLERRLPECLPDAGSAAQYKPARCDKLYL